MPVTKIFSTSPGFPSGFTGFGFTTIQTDTGTSPVADGFNDTLTLTSSDGSVSIVGNSTTDTVDLSVSDSSWQTDGNAGLVSPVLGTTDPVSISVRTNGIGRIYLDALTEKMNFLGGLGTDPDDLSGKFNFAGVVSISPDTQANENGALYLTNESRAPDPVPVGTRQIAMFSDDSGTLGLKSDAGSGFKINLTGQITNPDDTFVMMPSAASSASTVWVLEDTAQTLTNKTISFDSNALTGRVSGGTKSIYVSKSGNDSTGDGTYFYPYLTITKALTVATGATAADPYFIYIYPGAYTETAGFKFKSFCHMMGVVMGGNPVQITCSGGIGSDLLGASPILFMENIQFISAVTVKPDSTATGSAIVKPNHCQFVSTLEVSRSTSCDMSFTLENNSFTEAAMTIKSAYVEFDYSFALSSITCTHVGGAALGELGMYGAFFTSISMNNSGASGGSIHLASSGSYNNGGTISVTGSGATLKSDADSLPLLASNVTLASGATMSLLTSAYAVKYTPTTGADWVATDPVSVLEGLDDLAKRWATGTFTGTSITQNTKALQQMHTYNGGSAQVFGATGFGTIANFQNGTRITIIGTDAVNSLTLYNTDAADGYLLKAAAVLVKGSAITLMYNSTLARMVEVSRSI